MEMDLYLKSKNQTKCKCLLFYILMVYNCYKQVKWHNNTAGKSFEPCLFKKLANTFLTL